VWKFVGRIPSPWVDRRDKKRQMCLVLRLRNRALELFLDLAHGGADLMGGGALLAFSGWSVSSSFGLSLPWVRRGAETKELTLELMVSESGSFTRRSDSSVLFA